MRSLKLRETENLDKTADIPCNQKGCVCGQICNHIRTTLTECRAKLVNSLNSERNSKPHTNPMVKGINLTDSGVLSTTSDQSECMCVSRSVVSYSLWFHGLKPTRLFCPWNSSDRIPKWVAISFSRGSSQPWDRTQVSCIAGGFFTIWATREAWSISGWSLNIVDWEATPRHSDLKIKPRGKQVDHWHQRLHTVGRNRRGELVQPSY